MRGRGAVGVKSGALRDVQVWFGQAFGQQVQNASLAGDRTVSDAVRGRPAMAESVWLNVQMLGNQGKEWEWGILRPSQGGLDDFESR